MTSYATLTEEGTPARRRRVPMWIWGAAGAAAVLVYGFAVERMRFGPPLVMLALGGMTLAFAAGALWRMIDPLARAGGRRRRRRRQGRGFVRELEREKQLVLKAIKEIEFDYQMRKISERDYRDMIERYRNRAMRLISELDAGGDYRGLIEKELKLRLELPVTDAPRSRGCRDDERAGRRRSARPARPKTIRTRSSANMRRETLERLVLAAALLATPAAGAQPMMGASGGGSVGRMPNLSRSSAGRCPIAGCRPAPSACASPARCRRTRSRTSR